MTSSKPSDARSSERPKRVQPLVVGKRDRTLLASWIADETDYGAVRDVDVDDDGIPEPGDADLYIIDAGAFQRRREELDKKKVEDPALRPLLLVTTRAEARRLEVDPWSVVDDVIWQDPASVVEGTGRELAFELRGRLRALLRARELSVGLDEERDRYRRLLRSLPVGVLLLADGELQYLNEPGRRMFGAEEGELPGTSLEELVFTKSRARVRSLVDGADQERRAIEFVEARFVQTDGSVFTAGISAEPVSYEGKSAVQLTIRDLTERQQRRQRLEVLDRVLRHNLRNQLGLVLGCADQLVDGDADPEAMGQQIRAATEDLLELSDTAREFQRTIRHEARVQPTDLALLAGRAIERSEVPEDVVATDLPEEALVLAHEGVELALTRVLAAINRKERDPELQVAVVNATESNHAELQVASGGEGIPSEVREVLNEGAETSLSHADRLDLWLLKWAVDGAGGDLHVMGQEPQGALLSAHFPRVSSSLYSFEKAEDGSTVSESLR